MPRSAAALRLVPHCPDIGALVRHSAEPSDEVADHVHGCAPCGEVLTRLIRAGRASAPPHVEEPRRGDVLGRYVVQGPCGAGAMAVVLHAHDTELDRDVALKLMRAGRREERLMREARLMARVRHPNVVTVYDAGRIGDRIFLAMELIDGVTLRAWLAEQPRERHELLDVFAQAGRGLAAAHAAGLVHRDFKPDNVLVEQTGRAFVTDFGAADAPHGSAALAGTAPYMAPEQIAGRPIDARADQFSFCVALYEALVGARPFSGLNRDEEPELDPRLPRHLAAVLRRGLALDAADRFASMDALLEALLEPPRRRPWLALASLVAW